MKTPTDRGGVGKRVFRGYPLWTTPSLQHAEVSKSRPAAHLTPATMSFWLAYACLNCTQYLRIKVLFSFSRLINESGVMSLTNNENQNLVFYVVCTRY